MLSLRYRAFWIAASVVLVTVVVWGSLQTAFGGPTLHGFDKVEHFSTYMFLAAVVHGPLSPPALVADRREPAGARARDGDRPVRRCSPAAWAIPSTWPPTRRASSPAWCWRCCSRAAGRRRSSRGSTADTALPSARRSHAAGDPRRVHRPGAPARAGQAAAPPARRQAACTR